jgi:hypothetical protein
VKTCADIISDEEVEREHFGNFGDMGKREVVEEGVLKYAFGYQSGYTQLTILIGHGLVRKPPPGSYYTTLTKKGQSYLRAMCRPSMRQLREFMAPVTPDPTMEG